MNRVKIFLLLFISIIFAECGDPSVNINNASYEPKITVEAYLYCGETVKDIRLSRNFTLGVPIDTNQLYLTPAENNVVITVNGTPLNFDPNTDTYYNDQITIGYNKIYNLAVSASIDGRQLHTTSTTTTPQEGFEILNKNMGQFKYNGNLISLNFTASPGTDFYAFSIVPDSASLSNFIYDNLFRNNIDTTEILKNFNDYIFRRGTLFNIDSYSNNVYSFVLNNRDTWFYSSYKIIAYAGDNNFKDYFITAPSVQEFDGNFHEPIPIFKGDGIGVFASAVKDSATFSIIK
jgi:hypothetical protein